MKSNSGRLYHDHHPLGKSLLLTLNLTLPMQLHAVCLCPVTVTWEISTAPLLPSRWAISSVSIRPPSLSFIFSGLNRTRDFSNSFYIWSSRLFNIFVALLWMLSNSFMFFLCCSTQTCTRCLRWGWTAQSRAEQCRYLYANKPLRILTLTVSENRV